MIYFIFSLQYPITLHFPYSIHIILYKMVNLIPRICSWIRFKLCFVCTTCTVRALITLRLKKYSCFSFFLFYFIFYFYFFSGFRGRESIISKFRKSGIYKSRIHSSSQCDVLLANDNVFFIIFIRIIVCISIHTILSNDIGSREIKQIKRTPSHFCEDQSTLSLGVGPSSPPAPHTKSL